MGPISHEAGNIVSSVDQTVRYLIYLAAIWVLPGSSGVGDLMNPCLGPLVRNCDLLKAH